MRKTHFLAIPLLAASGLNIHAEPNSQFVIQVNAESLNYSESMPIKQFMDELKGPKPDSGDIAFTFNHAEINLSWRNINVSLFQRLDYLLEYSEDTFAIAYADENDTAYPIDQPLSINIEANHIEAQGIGVSYDFNLGHGLTITPGLNYLQADALTDGYLSGNLYTPDGEEIIGELNLDYAYQEDLLLGRPQESIDGSGFSADIFALWQWSAKGAISFNIKDAWSRITWQDVTYTTASASTDNLSFDSQGHLEAASFLSGRAWYRNQHQKLPQKTALQTSYQLSDNLQATLGYESIASYHDLRIGGQWHWHAFTLEGGYRWHAQAFDLGLRHQYFQLKITSDSSDRESAKMLGLNITLAVPL